MLWQASPWPNTMARLPDDHAVHIDLAALPQPSSTHPLPQCALTPTVSGIYHLCDPDPLCSPGYRRGTAPLARITRSPSGLRTKSRNFLIGGVGSPMMTKRKSR